MIFACSQASLSPMDRWLLHQTFSLVRTADDAMQSRSLNLLVNSFVKFWITQLCDVYLVSYLLLSYYYYITRLPVTRWVNLSLNYDSQSRV